MREYYIFRIKSSIKIVYNSYNIFKLLNDVYNKRKESGLENVLNKLESDKLNNKIYNLYKSDIFYTIRNNIHKYNDYFSNEESALEINKYYIKLKSNKNLPTFLYDLAKYNDLFIIDFKAEDYFWANEINAKLLV